MLFVMMTVTYLHTYIACLSCASSVLRWLAVLFYFAFLLVTVVIMLNVLIAQMSNTYVTVRGNARALATYHRARFLLRYLRYYEYWRRKCIKWNQTKVRSLVDSWYLNDWKVSVMCTNRSEGNNSVGNYVV